MGQLRPLFRLMDNPIPVLGLTPRARWSRWCPRGVGQGDGGSLDGAGGGGARHGHGAHTGGWGHGGGIPCDSPQEQTLIALQYHLFSVQTVLAQVFLLWCLHYWVQQQFNVFFTFLP